MKKNLLVLTLALAVFGLSACNNVKQQLGVGRNSPDEFTVVKRAPLSMPPEYDLRPPADGDMPSASSAAEEAKAGLMGKTSQAAASGSGENALLEKMGAAGADPSVRAELNRENGYLAVQNQTVAKKLIFWDDEEQGATDAPASIVDPKKEAERLKKNAKQGKKINEGEVPVIEKKKGTIDKIF
jgi:predicted small secreted protein